MQCTRRDTFAIGAHAMFTILVGIADPASAQVTSCGQIVDEDAALAGDLDCTGSTVALTIKKRAVLDLAGFSVTGAPLTCIGSCTIRGPGMIAGITGGNYFDPGASLVTVLSATVNGSISYPKHVVISDSTIYGPVAARAADVESSTITGSDTYGLAVLQVSLTGSTVTGNIGDGVVCKRCLIYGSTISSNKNGVTSRYFSGQYRETGNVQIYDSFVTDNVGDGIYSAKRARVYDTVISGNWRGVLAFGTSSGLNGNMNRAYGTIEIQGSTISSNTGNVGISAYHDAIVSTSTITGNGKGGIKANRKIILDAAHVTANATDVTCLTPEDCPDLYTHSAPMLLNGSTCETSWGAAVDDGSGGSIAGTWGICSLD